MTEEYDVTQPILILVRRGRGDRGYLVAAVDDASNPFPCVDETEVGKAVVEMLNDTKQPRFDEKQLEAASADYEEEEEEEEEEDIEEDEDEEEEEEEEEPPPPPPPDPLDELGLDPGEKLLFRIGEKLLGSARHMSNDYRDKRKKRKKKKKKKKRRA